MKKFFILFVFACTACSPTGKNGTAPLEINGFKKLSLPLVIDTTFIQSADTLQKLSYQQVRGFGNKFLGNESDHDFFAYLNDFCKIDSLKENKKYAAYMDNLDIGMTKNALACKIGYAALNDSAQLFLWSLRYDSYEACPVFSGTKIIGSYKNISGQYICVLLGDMSFSTDPPSAYQRVITTIVSKDAKFATKSIAVMDDSDVPGCDSTIATLQLAATGSALKITAINLRSNAAGRAR